MEALQQQAILMVRAVEATEKDCQLQDQWLISSLGELPTHQVCCSVRTSGGMPRG